MGLIWVCAGEGRRLAFWMRRLTRSMETSTPALNLRRLRTWASRLTYGC